LGPKFRCLCCEAPAATPVYPACRDLYLGTPFLTDYYRCDACGLVQQSPVPGDTAPFYANYPVHRRKSGASAAAGRVLMSRVYYRPAAKARVLLDYGCGDGAYLERVRRPGVRVIGFETDAAHAAGVAARVGVPVFSDASQLLARHASGVDVVTMHSVLEHVTDLHGTFDLAARLLRPGGVLYVVVPQADSNEARLFGRRWHGLDPPRHVSFPGPPVMARLAAAHGFQIRRQEAVPFPTALAGSVANVLAGRFSFAVMAAALPFTLPFTLVDPGAVRAFTLEKR
jgi:SAM-dependent methyltransferase